MRRKDREITDKETMEAVLDTAPLLRLGLYDGEKPYVVPLNFVRSGDALFFHCAKEGRKLDIIREYPKVCFEATGQIRLMPGSTGCDCSTFYESVIGWGTARLIDAAAEKSAALAALNLKHDAAEGPFPPAMLEETVVVRIDIDRMTGKAKREIPSAAKA